MGWRGAGAARGGSPACAKYSRSGVDVHMPSTIAVLAAHEMLRRRPTTVSAPASVLSLGGAWLAEL